jgi:hypothetical protein
VLQFRCQFCDSGFCKGGFAAWPCYTRYHVGCIRMGVPFTTRLSNDGGMYCPKDLAAQIQFICEACTVRSVLGAELQRTPRDTVLLMLEQARLIDTCNNWSSGTLKAYQSKYNVIGSFERDFGVVVLPKTIPIYPPRPSHQTHVGTRTLFVVPCRLAEETRYSRRNHQVRHRARSPLCCISFLDVGSPANAGRQIHVRLQR